MNLLLLMLKVLESVSTEQTSKRYIGETRPAISISTHSVLPRSIKTMLFVDIEGFSGVEDCKVPEFLERL